MKNRSPSVAGKAESDPAIAQLLFPPPLPVMNFPVPLPSRRSGALLAGFCGLLLAACSSVETLSTTLRPSELRGTIACPGPLLPAQLQHPPLPPEPFHSVFQARLADRGPALRSVPVAAGRLPADASPARAAEVGRTLGVEFVLLPVLREHGVVVTRNVERGPWGGPWAYPGYGWDPFYVPSGFDATTRSARVVDMDLTLVRAADAAVVWQGRGRASPSSQATTSSWLLPPSAPAPPPATAAFLEIADDTAAALLDYAPGK